MKNILKDVKESHLNFQVKSEHIEETIEKIKILNNKRIKIFGILMIVSEILLILLYDFPIIYKKENINISKIYFVLHCLILIFSIIILKIIIIFDRNLKIKKYDYFYCISSTIILSLIAPIGAMDQLKIGSISSYVGILLVVGSIILLKKPYNYIVFTIPQLIFLVTLYKIVDLKTFYASSINSLIFYICVIIISKLMYENQFMNILKNIILEDMNKKMEVLSNFDSLTELPNRRYFEDNIKKNILNKKNIKKNIIAIMDIDYFKRINDKLGHQIGDNILKEIACIIKKDINTPNIVARWGGEEFIFFFTNVDLNEAFEILEDIRLRIEKHRIFLEDKEIRITASFGFEFIEGNTEESINSSFKLADIALYSAKKSGRNKVVKSRGVNN